MQVNTPIPLTDTAARKAKPKEKNYKVADLHGLYLLVTTAGRKYWRVKYRIGGREKVLALGVYPEVTLNEARDKQAEARKLLRNGQDPAEVKRAQKRHVKTNAENSFENIAREWHRTQGRWTRDQRARVLGSLEKEAFPNIGAKSIQEITAPAIVEVIERIEKRDATARAFRLSLRHPDRPPTYNPAADLAGSLKTRKVTHRAALSRADLPDFLKKLDAYDGQPITRRAPPTTLGVSPTW